jgi:hypothetical protein
LDFHPITGRKILKNNGMTIYPAITISKRIPKSRALKYKIRSVKLVIEPCVKINAIRQNTFNSRMIKKEADNA